MYIQGMCISIDVNKLVITYKMYTALEIVLKTYRKVRDHFL